mmetsp:Transcript_67123/g.194300  ORF Transcript_67123/g.194300 Transcript_67123/m.194300 type:complete len:248 (-) Transcript_67123:347-1090(-)
MPATKIWIDPADNGIYGSLSEFANGVFTISAMIKKRSLNLPSDVNDSCAGGMQPALYTASLALGAKLCIFATAWCHPKQTSGFLAPHFLACNLPALCTRPGVDGRGGPLGCGDVPRGIATRLGRPSHIRSVAVIASWSLPPLPKLPVSWAGQFEKIASTQWCITRRMREDKVCCVSELSSALRSPTSTFRSEPAACSASKRSAAAAVALPPHKPPVLTGRGPWWFMKNRTLPTALCRSFTHCTARRP